jgi:hypothetical protein
LIVCTGSEVGNMVAIYWEKVVLEKAIRVLAYALVCIIIQ